MPPRRLAAASVALTALIVLPVVGADGQEAPAVAPAGEWLAGDLHAHTSYSHDSYGGPGDDNTGPEEAYTLGHTVTSQFAVATSRGLDFLAVTDHNDVRSQSDPGWGTGGVIGVPAYENSLSGHAQMLGATQVYDTGNDAESVAALADRLRADGGVFQVNHPGSDGDGHLDWSYGYTVVPDTVEVWNISRLYQPPLPSASSNDEAVSYWEGWLDRGFHVAATGGSDNHYLATTPVQGVGQPTTHVFATDRSSDGVLDGIRAGRTTISHQPPALGGPTLFLEADRDGDGSYESMVGDTVVGGSALRVRAERAAGASLRIVTDGGTLEAEVPVTDAEWEHRFTVPADRTWVRAELFSPDLAPERAALCPEPIAGSTTYCRDQLLITAMTSALYLEPTALPVEVTTGDGTVEVDNGLVRRTWQLDGFGTTALDDLRTGRSWPAGGPDFRLELDGVEVQSTALTSAPPTIERIPDGVRLVFDLGVARREVLVWDDVAGFRERTILDSGGVVSGYTLAEIGAGAGTAELHWFRAGADWREPDWDPPAIGDAATGDWRVTTTGPSVSGPGQWLTVTSTDGGADGPRLFTVAERVDYQSTVGRFDGERMQARVDLSRDVVYLGPLEESGHVGNPTDGPARHRVVRPGTALEWAFVGVATGADDEPAQWDLAWRHVSPPWSRDVTWNSNQVDGNRISTGAKDDMDMAEVRAQAAVARRIGVETFVLDDGWQARSGDWCPDSPDCPEPRYPTYPHRFPDSTFAAVRQELGAMGLGLWMSPMHFHSSAETFAANPQWSCVPVGTGTAALTAADPESGSSEAGLGTWNPVALGRHPDDGRTISAVGYVEDRIRGAITEYGARYFKFDFLVWLDCAGVDSADAYEYREAFVAMLDRLARDFPSVTLQIDETNDYRLFPFESIVRGPSWFQNGSPTSDRLLHNLWSMAPYVPPSTIGQHALGNRQERAARGVDYLMAVALPSHLTFWLDLTELTEAEQERTAFWTALYQRERDRFTGGPVYPLLDDPAGGATWTALQSWNATSGSGALLVYRQDAPGSEKNVPLRGLDPATRYRIRDLVSGKGLDTFTGEQLRRGALAVRLPARHTAAVYGIDRLGR